MSLDIQHVSLAELMSRAAAFYMARYQRHYEWGRREMEQLLEDLSDAFEMHQLNASIGAFHFLGNVILFENPDGKLEVVDGQQRLTSLTLLLAVTRDICTDAALQIELNRLLFAGGANGNEPRLNLHRGDQEFLRNHILPNASSATLDKLGEQDHASAEHLKTNALIAKTWLANLTPADQMEFVRFIMHRGRFVEIMVANEDDAFRIFETVNNRGRPISSEDVLRYALVEFATDDLAKREDLLEQWDVMEAELGPRGMKRFISGWRARATKGARARQSLHRTLLDSFKTPAEARAFLESELSSDLAVFQQINTADIEIEDGPEKRRIDTILRSLALLDFDEWLPVVSVLISKAAGKPARLVADLARIERLAWFYYLNRDDKGIYLDRRDRFSSLMKIVSSVGTFEALPARSLLSVEDCSKMRDILQERLDPKWIPLRSLLVRLEMALVGDGMTIIREDLTIEHVLPLRPKTKAWLSLFGNSPRTVTEHAERIGNLCLVSSDLNSKLGNLTYPNKRKLMQQYGVPAQSPLAADIAIEKNWTREVIARRSKWLLQVFCDTFDVHAPRR